MTTTPKPNTLRERIVNWWRESQRRSREYENQKWGVTAEDWAEMCRADDERRARNEAQRRRDIDDAARALADELERRGLRVVHICDDCASKDV